MTAMDNANAQQFVNRVNKTGGASMDAGSGKLLNPGKRGYMVGGEPDTAGNQIPPTSIPADQFGPEHVTRAMNALHHATGGRSRVNLGAWNDGEGNVVLDAASRVKRPGEAMRKGRNRNQKAVWDNKRMREIDTGGNDKQGGTA
jgi:hypothetical protein